MAAAEFAIPAEFDNDLKYRPCKDPRTDVEILSTLAVFNPVIGEKNVWCFWDAGIQAMPSWTQRNVVDWVRLLDDSWTVRILDSVPGSPNNALRYIGAEMLPEAYVKGTMDGPYKGPHAADLLRGACVFLHGGVYMDVGIILIRHLDRICWNQLEDPNSRFEVAIPWMWGVTTANHFIAARKGNPFVKRWHDLFAHLWRNRTQSEGLIKEPLISGLDTLDMDQREPGSFAWDFNIPFEKISEYITQIVCWKRVCLLEDPTDGFNGPEYWQRHVLIWDSSPEAWGGEEVVGFVGAGQKMFDLFSVRLDADREGEDYKQAYALTWRLLKGSSMQKVTHGKGLTSSVHLGKLLDENPGRTSQDGTFWALLRYGSLNFEQTREMIAYVEAPRPPLTLRKRLLEV